MRKGGSAPREHWDSRFYVLLHQWPVPKIYKEFNVRELGFPRHGEKDIIHEHVESNMLSETTTVNLSNLVILIKCNKQKKGKSNIYFVIKYNIVTKAVRSSVIKSAEGFR